MPTPPKPFTVLKAEKKSHRTKAELKQRQKGEEALVTGVALKSHKEVRDNPVAYKEFKRINKLLKKIEKNDAIYESVINRYCLILAECKEMSTSSYYKMKHNMQTAIINLDKQVQTKRKMLFDIEKENIMTIAAALRSIPKKEEKQSNPLLEALKND